jgi:hypothetical protein
MSEWWSYRLADFLMFSPQVYQRLFELQNREWWPAPLLALIIGFVALGLAWLRGPAPGRVVSVLLALAWLFVAWSFFIQRYAAIHLAGNVVAAAFVLQALLLLWLGIVRVRLVFTRDVVATTGLALVALALAGWPLLAPIFGRAWWQAEVFAMAPDPTAVATLGVLLASRSTPWLLIPIPALWLLFNGATLASMAAPLSWLGPVAVLLTLAAAMMRPSVRE